MIGPYLLTVILPLTYLVNTASVTRSSQEPQEAEEDQWGDWEEDQEVRLAHITPTTTHNLLTKKEIVDVVGRSASKNLPVTVRLRLLFSTWC